MIMVLLTFLLILTMMSLTVKSIMPMMVLLLATALFSTILVAGIINSWFGLILFLIYISGLLVLFGYMLAMTPNSHSFNAYIVGVPTAFLIGLCVSMISKVHMLPEMKQAFEPQVIDLFSKPNMPMYWFMVLLLLLVLLMVVNLVYKSPAPMRPFSK